MAESSKKMGRRDFLCKTPALLLGSLLGMGLFSKAFAFQPRIALIIDDIGYSRRRAMPFLDLPIDMTFSILPKLRKSQELAREIHHLGQEVMLHQPMEPYDPDLDPGPGALFVGDGPEKITRTLDDNISEIPYAVGVNNHMGSRFTASGREISEALLVVKKRDLLFVDSLTSSKSKAYKTAKNLRLPAGVRNTFLDNIHCTSNVYAQLQRLKRHALHYGQGIGIGHPYPETATAIGQFIKDIQGSGISFVHVSRLIEGA